MKEIIQFVCIFISVFFKKYIIKNLFLRKFVNFATKYHLSYTVLVYEIVDQFK